ncbi:archaea-specific SMC-related protein [Haloarcula onubensis]|uniref:Chromosome segregation protein SMC n=1 Tax=Haloarcula onubensis TaxID=2950539 RepID=A0ABU2FK54_9EURY|nr:archaea-specific SMC-related protein [Halomicroarcula sp. S3CR25-11]MDS0280804.1 chromosome segregation protein SMC [Halomicroarcula sp. S3CR25-11]
MDRQSSGVAGTVSIRNIGGIAEQQVDLARGVNVLAGNNATNRTSFLKALAAAQGSEAVSLKGDTQSGSVELTIDGEQYRREIHDVDGSLVFEGSCPVPEGDREVAELFAFLFERNRAREAIRQGSDLHSVVMDPVDTAAIEDEIATLKQRRSQTERELEECRSLQQTLPSLRDRRDALADRIARLEGELAEAKAEIEAAESTVDEQAEETEALDAAVSALRTAESELDTVRSKIETTEGTLDHLETDRSEARDELDELAAVDESELADVEAELSRLHEQLADKESMMNELQNVIQFNKDFVAESEASVAMLSTAEDAEPAGATTESLVDDGDGIVCWTCGADTTRSQISETLDRLQAVHEDLYGEREQLKDRIETYKDRKSELESTRDARERLEGTVEELSAQIERNRETLSRLQAEETELQDEIDELENEIQGLRQRREDELLDRHRTRNALERDLAEAVEEHESVREEIADVEAEVERIDDHEAEIEQLTAQIEELRQRVDRIERQAVDAFNEHMDAILDILEYRNVDRVWVERRQVSEREGRRTVQRNRFDLHVIRVGEDGSTYEDTVAHLSESEREVTGLIFALAGYLVHDVAESVPFMLLDSLEAIDSDRIALLVDYLQTHADNLVVALLEEDAAALDGEYHRITQLAQAD